MNKAYEKGRKANRKAREARDRSLQDLIDIQREAHERNKVPYNKYRKQG